MTQQTSSSVQELDRVTQQNVASVQQLDELTQQNASASSEMAATAEQLSAEAARLRERIAFFRTGEEAPKPARETPARLATGGRPDVRALQARVGGFAATRPAPAAALKPAAAPKAAVQPKPAAKGGFALDLGSPEPIVISSR